jgi:hypothetical protein
MSCPTDRDLGDSFAWPMRTVIAAAVLMFGAAGTPPNPAHALQNSPADTAAIRGRVTDAGTGGGVAFALVDVVSANRRTLTDATGTFVLPRLESGIHRFEVSRMGYETYAFDVGVRPGVQFRIELFPEPVMLEGITAAVDRLAERTRRVPHRTYAWGEAELAAFGHPDVISFLNEQPWLICMAGSCSTVVQARGARPVVFIDEWERSWDQLQLYRTDELYRIEFIRNCGMIRVYTKRFMERVASGRVRLPNSFVGDCLWVRRALGLRFP